MSFQEPKDALSICNKALSRIRQQPLAGSLDDPANLNKSAARECKLWYKTVVRQVLSQHHWGLSVARTALVLNPTNLREGEWLYSYIAPTDMAFPVMIGPPYTGAGSSAVSYYRGIGYILASIYGRPLFRFENDNVYSSVEGAILDYVSFDLTEQDFSEGVEALIVLYLAAQLARSVAKDEKLGQSLHDEALARQNIEIALSLNVNQPRYDTRPSEAEYARAGFDIGLPDFGYFR